MLQIQSGSLNLINKIKEVLAAELC